MLQVNINNTTYIVSRIRNGTAELVERTTGRLFRLEESSLPATSYVERDLVPVIPFAMRSPTFLHELRELRKGHMLARLKAKRQNKNPSDHTPRKRPTKTQVQVENALAAKFANLPPELAQQAMALWKGGKI